MVPGRAEGFPDVSGLFPDAASYVSMMRCTTSQPSGGSTRLPDLLEPEAAVDLSQAQDLVDLLVSRVLGVGSARTSLRRRGGVSSHQCADVGRKPSGSFCAANSSAPVSNSSFLASSLAGVTASLTRGTTRRWPGVAGLDGQMVGRRLLLIKEAHGASCPGDGCAGRSSDGGGAALLHVVAVSRTRRGGRGTRRPSRWRS